MPEVAPEVPPQPMYYARKYESTEFGEFFEAFFSAVHSRDEWSMDFFLHPFHGLFVVYGTQDTPQVTRIYSFSEIEKVPPNRPFWENTDPMCFHLILDSIPPMDCSTKSGYARDGCFTESRNLLESEGLLHKATFSGCTKEEFITVVNTVLYTTVNTFNYKFYWALIDGYWYLGVLDLRHPC